jgi:hypothetical protein
MASVRDDDDDTSITEPETASGSEVSATKRPTRSDTIPDLRVEAHALLDRLLPSDGRAQPPRVIAKQGASSGGGSFVAYSGEGKPAEASKTQEPIDTVMVMKEPGETAIEAPRAARRALEKTQLIARRRSRRWLFVAGFAAGLVGLVVLFLALRG